MFAKDAKEGTYYFSETDISIRIWRKQRTESGAVFTVYVYVPEANALVAVPPVYKIKPNETRNSKIDPLESQGFDKRMLEMFFKTFPGSRIWDNYHSEKSQETKGESMTSTPATPTTPTATETTAATAETRTKKEIRLEYNQNIKTLKSERKRLSDENAELKTQLKTVKERTQRKEINDRVRTNVQRRAQLSDEIKTLSQKIRDLRVSPAV